jgi:hypothetical protein
LEAEVVEALLVHVAILIIPITLQHLQVAVAVAEAI